jgi:hypothetical protein
MMATIEAMKHKAGRLLGFTSWGRGLAADDDALLTESYAQIYDDLDEEGIATWPSTAEIPDRCMPHVAALVAFNVTADKSVSPERYSTILALRNVAKPEIRRMVTPAFEADDMAEDY